MNRALALALFAAAAVPGAASAQHWNLGVFGAPQIVHSHIDSSSSRLTGTVFGGEGTLVGDRFSFRLRYAQGNVTAKSDTGLDKRLVVEGEALAGFRATQWLTLWVGPTARAYTLGESDQRWLLWTGRASARGTLLPDRLQSYVELWGAITGSVGDPSAKAAGRGADAGIEMRLSSQTPLWGRFGYRIESSHADALRETVESITVTVIYGFPQ